MRMPREGRLRSSRASRRHGRVVGWGPRPRTSRIAVVEFGIVIPLGILINWASEHTEDLPQWLQSVASHPWRPLLAYAVIAIVILAPSYLRDRPAEVAPLPRPIMADGDRRKMLKRVRHQVEDLLSQPEKEPDPIPLGLDARQELVEGGRKLFEDRVAGLPQPPPAVTVFEIAQEALLILGGSGAGKSRLLTELAKDLLDRADRDPALEVPVLINLVSWTPRHRLIDWLITELNRRYEASPALGHAWIEGHCLTLLLDGLDETSNPASCIAAINAFRKDHGLVPIAVCCRLSTYQQCGVRLRLGGAVQVRLPTPAQVERFLAEAGIDPSALPEVLGDDENGELLRSPLLLSTLMRTYRADVSQAELAEGQQSKPLEDLLDAIQQEFQPYGITLTRDRLLEVYLDRLLRAYVRAMLARQRVEPTPGVPESASPYPEEKMLAWLGWLARLMQYGHLAQFRLDRLQPIAIPGVTPWKAIWWWSSVVVGVPIGLAVGLVSWLFSGAAAGLASGLGGGLYAGLITRALADRNYEIEFAETYSWSWREVWEGLRSGLIAGLIAGFTLGLVVGVVAWLVAGPYAGLDVGVRGGLAFGLAIGSLRGVGAALGGGLSSHLSQELRAPNEGVRRSARHGLAVGLIAGLVAGLTVGSAAALAGGQAFGLAFGLGIGLAVALAMGLYYGILACVQHFVLRALLVRDGCAPWRYVRFLDYAVDRILLRRVGAAYEFIHPLLLKHFAENY